MNFRKEFATGNKTPSSAHLGLSIFSLLPGVMVFMMLIGISCCDGRDCLDSEEELRETCKNECQEKFGSDKKVDILIEYNECIYNCQCGDCGYCPCASGCHEQCIEESPQDDWEYGLCIGVCSDRC